MHDAPILAAETMKLDAEILTVLDHRPDLARGSGLAHDFEIGEAGDRHRRCGVIHGGQREVRSPDRKIHLLQQRECLRCSDLVYQVQIDVDDRRGLLGLCCDRVSGPDFLEKRRSAHME